MRLILASTLCAASLLAAAALSAPALKTTTDPPAAAAAGEPVEPGVHPATHAEDAALRARDSVLRRTSMNNLKQIGIAVHNYVDANNNFPDNIVDKDGKPLLSWRVLLLPYIEQAPLYNQFKLDEPWDSANNRALLEQMPKIYQSPRITTKKKGYIAYQGFSGPDALFGVGKVQRFPANIPDGTSNTIMIVENSTAVPWTKPQDIPFDPQKDLPNLGKAYGSKPLALMCDGSMRLLDLKKIKPDTLKAAIGPRDGLILGDDWE